MDKSLIPKILAVIYIGFISMFAFDTPILSVGFLTHMIPIILLMITLIFSWKNEKFGAIAFLVLAFGFTLFFNTYKEIIPFLVITLPLLIISALFWMFRRE